MAIWARPAIEAGPSRSDALRRAASPGQPGAPPVATRGRNPWAGNFSSPWGSGSPHPPPGDPVADVFVRGTAARGLHSPRHRARAPAPPPAGRGTAGDEGGRRGASLPGESLRGGAPDRLERRARRPDLPAHLPAAGNAGAGSLRSHDRADPEPCAPRGGEGRCARDPARTQPESGRPEGPQRPPRTAGPADSGDATQVPRDGALLSGGRPDVPQLLHLLLPLASVRGRARPALRGARGPSAGQLPEG
jgi:hypothetical protein